MASNTTGTTTILKHDDNNWFTMSSSWYEFSIDNNAVLRLENQTTSKLQLDLAGLFASEQEKYWVLGMIRAWWDIAVSKFDIN